MITIPHSSPTLGQAEAEAAASAVQSGHLSHGPECQAFERELAEAVGRRFAVVVASGHAALELWLESQNLPLGTSVRIPSYCCAAVRHSISRCGLNASIEDVEEDTLGLANKSGIAISANMFAVPSRGAIENNLEDCAMGFVPGVTGIRSQASLLSFYATKMLTTGQGGALLTDDENLAELWRERLQYDNQGKYFLTTNRLMTDIQAAIGRVQLKRYEEFLDKRRVLLGCYKTFLNEHGLKLHPITTSAAEDVLFRLPLLVSPNLHEQLIDYLLEKGIEAKCPVWRPLHRDAGLNSEQFPVSEDAQKGIISLPFYPNLSEDDTRKIVYEIANFLNSYKS